MDGHFAWTVNYANYFPNLLERIYVVFNDYS